MVIPEEYESDYSYVAPPPMLKTWISAITRPTIENFRRLAQHEMAILDTSVRWLLIATVVSAVINMILNYFDTMQKIGDWSNVGYMIAEARENAFVGGSVIVLVLGMQACAIPIGLLLTAAVLMFYNWLANRMGAKGAFESYVYICVAWIAPLTILAPILYRIPIVGPYIMGLQYLFQAYLMVTTLRAIKQLSIPKSLFVTLFPVIGFLGIAAIMGLLYGIVYLVS